MTLSTTNPEEIAAARTRRDADALHTAAIHLLRRLRRLDDLPATHSSGKPGPPRLSHLALNGPRLSALSVIVFAGPVTLNQLAAAEQVRPPTMTRIVHALANQKLVTKSTDPDDARSIRIAASMLGKRALLAGRGRRLDALAEAITRLPAADQAALRRALPALAKLNGLL